MNAVFNVGLLLKCMPADCDCVVAGFRMPTMMKHIHNKRFDHTDVIHFDYFRKDMEKEIWQGFYRATSRNGVICVRLDLDFFEDLESEFMPLEDLFQRMMKFGRPIV